MPRPGPAMPYLVAVRLSHADYEKLKQLCRYTQRQQGELLRMLIRLAQPVDGYVLPLEFRETEASQPASER